VIHGDELAVFIVLFLLVTVIGFWPPGGAERISVFSPSGAWADAASAGVVTLVPLGGDLYHPRYTFVGSLRSSSPKGAIGLFALPYTIHRLPRSSYVVMPKSGRPGRNLATSRGGTTCRDRFKSPFLALLIRALTRHRRHHGPTSPCRSSASRW